MENKENKNIIDEEDEIKVLKKYKDLDSTRKILICMYVLIALMVVNIALPYVVAYIQTSSLNAEMNYDTSDFKSITASGIPNLGKTSGKDVLFICSENYQECHDFIDVVRKAQKEHGFNTFYLEASELNDENAKDELLKFDNDKKFISSILGQVPIVLVLSENKLVEGWVGISSYENYEDFLKKSSVIK